jgi:hypothetical protein
MVSAGNEPDGPDAAAVVATRPVVLVRYRSGVRGETTRVVHVVPLPTGEHTSVSAVCGAVLLLKDIETVTPGVGMPCTVCVLTHAVTGTTSPGEQSVGAPVTADAAGLAGGGACYPHWGWPVTVHRDQVQLSVHRDVSALAIPIPLCTQIIQILTQRQCAPAVLAHPGTPGHHIILTGERYGVPLPWPAEVHQVTGVLLLPPTMTARGPVTWARPPCAESLRLCREIDLFGALRTALRTHPADQCRSRLVDHPPPEGRYDR